MKLACALLLLIAATGSCFADVVQTKSGNRIECVVIQENPDSVLVRRGYGTMTLPRYIIASIDKSPIINSASVTPTTKPTPGQRIPAWSDVLATLVKQKWAKNVQQIPATVVDVGVLASVPYQSYRCGDDYEVNIYGDHDHPAGIEIGVYRSLLTQDEAKQNCVSFIASVLCDKTDADLLRSMNRAKDKVTRGNVSVEITAATDPDAYGGWWVSVYDEEALKSAKASPAELNQITVAKESPTPLQAATTKMPTTAPVTGPAVVPATPAASDNWTPSDISYARPSGTGRVYVRGYTRKDGTYVHSYSRRR